MFFGGKDVFLWEKKTKHVFSGGRKRSKPKMFFFGCLLFMKGFLGVHQSTGF